MNVRVLSLLLFFSCAWSNLAVAQNARVHTRPRIEPAWVMASAGPSFLLQTPPGGAGLRVGQEFGLHLSDSSTAGFALALALGQTFQRMKELEFWAFDASLRGEYLFDFAIGPHTFAVGPSVRAGASLWKQGASDRWAFLLEPEAIARLHIANSSVFLDFRGSFPIYFLNLFGDTMIVRAQLLAGLGLRF